MARLPSWRDQLAQDYTSARKWGTGVNPVHAKRAGFEGRNTAPGYEIAPDTGLVSLDMGYVDDEIPGMDTSYMSEHPGLGDPSIRGSGEGMPPWGHGYAPTPQGTISRIFKRGMSPREQESIQEPNARGGDGWENKLVGEVNDSEVSDDSQIFVQTSRRQRDAIRNNTAATMRGTDASRHEISSRIPGMRAPVYSGGPRHYDMEPKAQEYFTRPWKYRGVGTGDPEWMKANEFQSVQPRRREIPADVYQGDSETDGSYMPESDWWY